MNKTLKNQKGITMLVLVITVVIMLILTGMLVYNSQDSVYVNRIENLNNDLELLRDKVSEYYEEYGAIPAKIKYTNTTALGNLNSVISTENDTGDFYVIDLEAMQGITLNYGRDYENITAEADTASYTDVYIINENSHNIFYVKGIDVRNDGVTTIYYTDYTSADDTKVDLRYIDGILIPEGYYYIEGTSPMVISNTRGDTVDSTNTNQYTWVIKNALIDTISSSGVSSSNLEGTQNEQDFLTSLNFYKGYFKNSEGKVRYSEPKGKRKVNYGSEIKTNYANIYSTYYGSYRNIPAVTVDASSVTDENYTNGNYNRLYSLFYNKMTSETSIEGTSNGVTENNFTIIKNGTNTNTFTQTVNNQWICIRIKANQATTAAQISDLNLKFDDSTSMTIEDAVENNYIEPLVLYEAFSSNESNLWQDLDKLIAGENTTKVDNPQMLIMLKIKNKAKISGLSFSTDKDWSTLYDGLKVYKLSDSFELSTKLF